LSLAVDVHLLTGQHIGRAFLKRQRTSASQSEDLLMKSTRNGKVRFAVTRVNSSSWERLRTKSSSLYRRLVVTAAIVLLTAGASFASFSLTFQGLVRTLNTGGSISLSSPAGIVVDPAGNVFVTDTGNGRIVEVNAQGTASMLTISGLSPALASPSGIALDGLGNLYVADTGNSRVVKVTPAGAGAVVSTGSVTLSSPRGVAVDRRAMFSSPTRVTIALWK
jgi:DNA-binding beta-propeller fold protein YncE